ncbi:MAG: transglycosylase SLT domain-containing protein [Candidatus Eremiobacteraeota bacterium]|nr:transglycosylase SLT domain-containing protein [Candidatus Eremiobacteraeota bacterium]
MQPALPVAYGGAIAAAAARYHLDPALSAAVAAQETGGPESDSGRNIVGDGGHGHGLFQIDDRWHAFARTAAAMDPVANADYAASLLADNLRRFHGDVHAALEAYNGGGAGYADSVLRHYDRIERLAVGPGARDGAATTSGKDGNLTMSIGNLIGGALQGWAMTGGNPLGAIAGGIGGAFGGSGNPVTATGNFGNMGLDVTQTGVLTGIQSMDDQNAMFELAMQAQAQQFNQMTEEKSELLREQNELRTVAMTQRKADDEVTKEFIKMIV